VDDMPALFRQILDTTVGGKPDRRRDRCGLATGVRCQGELETASIRAARLSAVLAGADSAIAAGAASSQGKDRTCGHDCTNASNGESRPTQHRASLRSFD